MIKYAFFFLLSAGVSFAVTPLVRLIAKKTNVVDLPSERKIHTKPIPLLGGLPIFLSLNLVLLLGVFLNNVYIKEFFLSRWYLFIGGQFIILLIGIYDDIKKISPGVKFLFQIFVGILLLLFGFGIHTISNPFSGNLIHLGLFSIPITILWVVGITNALNLVDGLDGLAAGTSFIVCATIAGLSFFNQNITIALISLILAGSILGFLRYNFHPAKIFLGDSGSLLLGFLLAVLSIQGSSKGATLVAVLAPILALGLPIMDTFLSMIRRFLKSVHVVDYPSKNGKFKALFSRGFSIFESDKDHVHHRLLKLGFSQRKAVVILYGLCIILCLLAFLSTAVKDLNSIMFMGAILIAVFIGIKSLHYEEFRFLEHGLLLPIFSFPVINNRVFHAFFDLSAISFTFYLSFIFILRDFGSPEKNLFIQSLPVVLVVKIIIFYISSLYKGSWLYSNIEDILKIVKAVFLSSLGSIFVLVFIFGLKPFGGSVFFLLDFYLLLTFCAGFRLSYKVIYSFYNRDSAKKGKKVLIYGAGHRGSILLEEIRHNRALFYCPVGFIDDDRKKNGKVQQGFSVLGSVDDLEKIVRKTEIVEILVSSGKIGAEKIKKLTEFCEQKGIIVRQFEFSLYEFA